MEALMKCIRWCADSRLDLEEINLNDVLGKIRDGAVTWGEQASCPLFHPKTGRNQNNGQRVQFFIEVQVTSHGSDLVSLAFTDAILG